MNIYNKINNYNNNYIIAEIEIKENDINKDIRIINSFEQSKREKTYIDKGTENYKYENEKEIKENCKIKINNKIISFSYFYKFPKIGKYKIIYEFKDILTKIDFIFCDCHSLININLSNFNTQNVTMMENMLFQCNSLKNIDLSNFNTKCY